MFLSFGDEQFRSILAQSDDTSRTSPYMELSSTFVHFINLQVAGLLVAVIAQSLDFYYDWPPAAYQLIFLLTKMFHCVGYFLFLYSVLSMLAATMVMFKICSWYEYHQKAQQHESEL